ncbi:NlpC/P60 family protein [Roseobacter sp. HKCCA0434]|uniref:C40 family peptidase n=1 Tax=Roseobacter sp. HKCCA0434 TaxID=3079297 RepID=UPI002905F3CC|nr:NlpC/P60 family protein [Roseobacter sp. HKCCA0434]
MSFDPRRVPARRDLAAAHLKGEVEADRFVEGRQMAVATASAPLTAHRDPEAGLASQLLHGERFTVYDLDDATGLAWGQAARDGYVGWVPQAVLDAPGTPTHVVTALMTHRYPEPDLKTRPFDMLPFLADVEIVGAEGRWLEVAQGGWVPAQHLGTERPGGDWVALAEAFLGAPYLWGGKTVSGLDCSALVQLSLHGVGRDCPRDSDMQEGEMGAEIDPDGGFARGDLVFWKGHVGVMADADRLLHANGHAMAVTYEPIVEARARIEAQGGGPVTTARRLD